MRGVSASIDLEGLGITRTEETVCIMFTNPHVFIHGTRDEFEEFTRLIAEKVEAKSGF